MDFVGQNRDRGKRMRGRIFLPPPVMLREEAKPFPLTRKGNGPSTQVDEPWVPTLGPLRSAPQEGRSLLWGAQARQPK